jgi:hypothetical protein
MLDPDINPGLIPFFSRAAITPMCARPLAPPPLNTKPYSGLMFAISQSYIKLTQRRKIIKCPDFLIA